MLELGGGKVAQGAVEALGVIEAGEGVEDLLVGVGVGQETRPVHEIKLESGPKGFHGCIIESVGLAAHGGDE